MDARGLSDYFLEIIDRSGHVHDRVSLQDEAVTMGRAYSNDIVIGDPYISPQHLGIQLQADGLLQVHDLDSTNGLSTTLHGNRVQKLLLHPGQDFFIGWTKIRFRDRAALVAPTLTDHSRHPVLSLFQNAIPLSLIVALSLLLMLVRDWTGHYRPVEWIELLGTPLLVYTSIATWAFLWALVSKLVVHRAWYFTHVGIAAAAVSLSIVLETVLNYAAFIVELDTARDIVAYLLAFLLMASALALHMRIASRAPFRHIALIAVLFSATLYGILFAVGRQEAEEFSSRPEYQGSLKAPAFVWLDGQGRQEFVAELEQLKEAADRAVARDQAEKAERTGSR